MRVIPGIDVALAPRHAHLIISSPIEVLQMPSHTQLKPHLSIMFDGHCEAAFRFYERCLNGTISFMLTWGHSPAAAEVPPDWAGKVYHATLRVDDFVMTGGDLPSDKYAKPAGFSIVLGIDNPADAERIFDELAQNGQIAMPLQETFWASRYGALVDQFGIAWEVNCERSAERDGGDT